MKKIRILAVLLALLLALAACQTASGSTTALTPASFSAQDKAALTEEAKRFVQAFIEQKFADMLKENLTQKMKDALSESKLKTLYEQLVTQSGKPLKIEGSEIINSPGYLTVSLIVAHESLTLRHNVSFDAERRLTGYHLEPYVAPTKASAFKTVELSLGKEPFVLGATLTYPQGEGPFPACVLVHGSGIHDRDETLHQNKPFRDIAEGLAARGIATLRYDKRGFVHAQALVQLQKEGKITIYDETIDDAVLALELLSKQEKINPQKLFILGHSLGANQAPRIAEKYSKVAGLMLLAGNVSPVQDLLPRQAEYLATLDDQLSDDEKSFNEMAKKFQERLNAPDYSEKVPASETFELGYNYWKDLYRYNPAEQAAKLGLPILLLQGERDYQVLPDELELWRKFLGGKAEYHLYPKLNHLFMAGEGQPGPDEYRKAGQVDAAVLDDIAAFVKGT